MINGLAVVATIALAIVLGQLWPAVGALIATLPIKILGYAVANPGGNIESTAIWLLVGSTGSMGFALTIVLFARPWGMTWSITAGLVVWAAIVSIAWSVLKQ